MTDDTPIDEERLAAGYRRRAERARALVAEFEGASGEADENLGDAPDW
jgi:hypothetical protein